MNIAIFGLGRVGLPLALYFAKHDQRVIGVDVDEKRLNILRKGQMPFLEEGADPVLKKHINNLFTVTSDAREAVEKSDVLILTLGTPVDENINPVFSQIEDVSTTIAPFLKAGQLLILRSTVSPGTTEYIKRFIESKTNFEIGKNFFLVYCPERISQGLSFEEFKEIPTIIGSLDTESAKKAENVFRVFSDKILHCDTRSAELTKLFTNMYRYINFAIANEFMMIADAHDRNIYKILELVNKDYKRGGLRSPGFTAGPCLFKDGFFLTNKIPFTELIITAWKLNESVPAYLIEKIKSIKSLNNSKVAILGLTFKKNSDDTRNSLSYKAKKIFSAEGAKIVLHDPYVKNDELNLVLEDADIVFLAMNHDLYKNLDKNIIKNNAKKDAIICDVWNLYKNKIIYPISEL